ncbi:MAG TPA: metallophosphoesterase [Spirochaetia bacterium]|nr:metallophosphoesterase [Spirochaetia bacterium]
MKYNTLHAKMKKRHVIGAALPLLVVLCGVNALLEPHRLEVKTIVFSDPDVPESFDGFTIAFLTDLHHGKNLSRQRLREVVKTTNDLEPDLILLGGDYVSAEAYIVPAAAELGRLRARHGVHAVLGNHDHWADAALTRIALQRSGIALLDNHSFWIRRGDERIRIGGVGDLMAGRQDLAPTIADVTESDFVLLVSHNPEYAEEIKSDRIDLMLAGHTHGGQITFFGLYAPILPLRTGQKYRSGVVRNDNLTVIVSNGIGTVGPPLRFFAPPQVVLVTLRRPDAADPEL